MDRYPVCHSSIATGPTLWKRKIKIMQMCITQQPRCLQLKSNCTAVDATLPVKTCVLSGQRHLIKQEQADDGLSKAARAQRRHPTVLVAGAQTFNPTDPDAVGCVSQSCTHAILCRAVFSCILLAHYKTVPCCVQLHPACTFYHVQVRLWV